MADTLDLRRAIMRCGECGQRFGADATFCPFDGVKLEPSAWDPSGDPLIGKIVDGRYAVLGVLGEGGMGTVYEVRHTALDRSFAMKVLRRDFARDPDLAARFTREAHATASVKHPNVVAISDFGHLGGAVEGGAGVPYFVMELLVGETLSRVIKTGGALPAALAVRIALKIAAGLGAAHDAKVVHRDLKPDNVFLLGDRTGRVSEVDVRVVDFGAAMILGTSRVTKTGVVFGTPHYMSPEQASGQPVDHRADVYALGVILYEMFTGRVPFEADTYMGVLTQHMFVKPVPPSQVSPAARELGALEEVTLRALEKKPEHRYATMQELAADVDRVAEFGNDGSLQVAPALDAPLPRRPRPLASELEPPAQDEIEASIVTRTSARRTRKRRERARAWLLYGGVVVGVAAVSVAGLRLAQRRAEEPPIAPGMTVMTTTASTLAAAAATSVLPAPVAAPAVAPPPSSSAAVTPVADAGAPSRPKRGRPARGAPSSGPATAPPASPPGLGTDFDDPWAKSLQSPKSPPARRGAAPPVRRPQQ